MIYLEAVGGKNKKNTVYGIGSSHSIFYGSGKIQNNTPAHHTNSEEYEKMQAELKKMKELVKTMNEQHQVHLKAVENRLVFMEERSGRRPDSPMADGDSHS